MTWDGTQICWWLLSPTGAHAINSELAAHFMDAGAVVYLGTYPEAAEIRDRCAEIAAMTPPPVEIAESLFTEAA